MRASVDSGRRLRDLQLIGPPGSGKTMLAKRLPTILKNWDVASLLTFFQASAAPQTLAAAINSGS
jgi:predicted ATPase with chaperone activity